MSDSWDRSWWINFITSLFCLITVTFLPSLFMCFCVYLPLHVYLLSQRFFFSRIITKDCMFSSFLTRCAKTLSNDIVSFVGSIFNVWGLNLFNIPYQPIGNQNDNVKNRDRILIDEHVQSLKFPRIVCSCLNMNTCNKWLCLVEYS